MNAKGLQLCISFFQSYLQLVTGKYANSKTIKQYNDFDQE